MGRVYTHRMYNTTSWDAYIPHNIQYIVHNTAIRDAYRDIYIHNIHKHMYRIQNYIHYVQPIVHTIAHSGRLSGHSSQLYTSFGWVTIIPPMYIYISCIYIYNSIVNHSYRIFHRTPTYINSLRSIVIIHHIDSFIASINSSTHSIINQFIHSMTSINRFNQLYTPIYPKTPKNPQK